MTKEMSPRLPEPQAPIDPLRRPFVGNLSVDENLKEILSVAIWNLLGPRERDISLAVTDGIARLDGVVSSIEEETALLKLVRGHAGIRDVINGLEIGADGTAEVAVARPGPGPRQFAHVVRFCGPDEASISAALRQALAQLDPLRTDAEAEQPLVVLYRNLLPGAVTLEIGIALAAPPAAEASGEIHIHPLPDGETGAPPPHGRGLAGVLAHVGALLAKGHPYAWQEVPVTAEAPLARIDAAPLLVPPRSR